MTAKTAPGLALLGLGLLLSTARACDIDISTIKFEGDSYSYVFQSQLDARISAVRAVITDHANLHRLNDNMVEARILERLDDDHLKRLLRLERCILSFCFELVFVENVVEKPTVIVTTVIPQESNFVDGVTTWEIRPLKPAVTQLRLSATQTPGFWIPPVLGPLILKRVFQAEMKETCALIESLAVAHDSIKHAGP